MKKKHRRQFIKASGSAAIISAIPFVGGKFAYARSKPKVVIIGGGAGGATVAHQLKQFSKDGRVDITLIEPRKHYTTGFFSAHYLGGLRSFESITHNYSGLAKIGITVIHTLADDVNTASRTVKLADGTLISYDKLVIAPGVDLKYDDIDGYSKNTSRLIPHAWTSDGDQIKTLRNQLQAMSDGGTVIIGAPFNPYSCPPAPYERACMIAHYLKNNKPRSKVLILDPKPKFSFSGQFQKGWQKYYGDMIEWRGTDYNAILSVDSSQMKVRTDNENIKGDVINIIPAQKAGKIAFKAKLTEKDWCPVATDSFLSSMAKNVYVLGDASNPRGLPKTGSLANSQAKVVASHILSTLGLAKTVPAKYNMILSQIIAPQDSIAYRVSYKAERNRFRRTSGSFPKTNESREHRRNEYNKSLQWYQRIAKEMFGEQTIAPSVVVATKPVTVTDRRIALVIGNADYKHTVPLNNPLNDARKVAERFRKLGFAEVTELTNQSRYQLDQALKDFGDRVEQADWAVIYYSGHGIQVDGQNYLVPIDAKLSRASHIEDETVRVSRVLSKVRHARKLRLVILDACRDNPFLTVMRRRPGRLTRSLSKGFSPVRQSGGVMVAFAARHGETALDGGGEHSPYVQALLKHLDTPGLEISLLFRRIRDTVLRLTNRHQEPFVYGSLPGEEMYFRPKGTDDDAR